MKKIISVLLCLALLCSFSVFVAAQEEEPAKKPTVCITAQDAVSKENKENAEFSYRWACLIISIANAEDFECCEINVTLNTPPYSKAPVITALESSNCANSLQKQEDDSYTITVGAPIKNEDVPFVVYAFVSEEDVPLEFTVNSVKLYTADGEIDQNDFVLDARRFNNGDFVRYDLNGDNKVTSEDARLALRFAVGLDTATDAQCRAVGVRDADSFTSDIARFILRAAVGLEGDAEKVVVNMEWVTDEETGYIIYHYSDGTYAIVGPTDGHSNKPDWFGCAVEKVVVNMEWVTDEETAYLLYHYSDGSYKVIGPLDAKSDRPDWL